MFLLCILYSYFEKGSCKNCTRQSQKVLWVVFSSLFFKVIWINGMEGHRRIFVSAKCMPTIWLFRGVGGGMGDVVWVMIFLPQTCGDIISFSPTYNGVRFFSRILSHERYFFPWYFLSRIFFPSKSSFKRFFSMLKSPIFKVKWSAPKGKQQK